ncbi:S-layer homology domain-containing protein [Paenibacillus sp. RS8]|uniref:S-layer homology domain-containing protein n=1 Tax=Paenibacillus sp. RS8 TaxID=3242681 RepID=UPI0035C0F2A9
MLKAILKIKQMLAVLLCTAMLAASSLTAPANVSYADSESNELPENIRIDKADFDTIPDIADYYKQIYSDNAVSYFNSINGESRIQRINFIQYPTGEYLKVNGEVTIDIPARDARAWRLFSDVRFEGSVAQTMELYVIDPKGVETHWTMFKNGGWNDRITGLYTNYTKMDFQESNPAEGITHPWLIKETNGNIIYEGYKMRIVGNGDLRSVYHWEEEGVPLNFDTSAWTVLGGDKDIMNVSVNVDALTNLSLDGVNKLPEEIFKRYHVNSGPVGLEQAGGEITLLDEAYHKTTNDYGFIPGRGAFHYPLLTNWAGLKEDTQHPGYADFTTTKEVYTKSLPAIEKFKSLYPSIGKDYMLTLDGWPKWMWENPFSGQSENFGTPSYANFNAAADASAKLIKSIDTRFDGLGPKYVEVKNESTIPQEWWFFQSEPQQAWSYLSEFHNKVAEAVKLENPDVLVGGPSSAFMYLENNDFEEARAQLKFMDETKDSMDFYSHHFYENSNLFIHDRENNPDGFLSGRMEAVLDLINAHMVNTDNVKPIYITEEGTYNTAGSEADYFQKLVAFNGYMLRFMNYSDTIGMLVPYLYPIINWRPNSNDTFYKYNEAQNGLLEEMTPMEAYLDMWKDYRGAFLPSHADHERVYTNAVRYNEKIYVAVHNLNSQRVNLDLNVLMGDANIADVKRKHFFLEKGNLTYEEENVTDLNNVYMRVQEMSVFEITLDSNPAFTKTWEREFAYAPEELVATSINAPAVFTIDSPALSLAKATLRIGFGKMDSGFAADMDVVVNPGDPTKLQIFSKDLNYTNKPGNLLTFAEFELDASKLLTKNTIEISIPEIGGYVTSVQIIQYDEQAAPTGVSTSALTVPIEDAKSKLASTVISSTGNEVEPGKKWVKKYIRDTLNIEVTKAEVVARDTLATDAEMDKAVQQLSKAMGIFDQYTKIKSSPTGKRGAKFSFEDEESAAYIHNVDTVTTTTGSQGTTDGSKALQVEFTSFTSYAWDTTGTYSGNLDFAAPEDGWSLNGVPFTFDVTNLKNYATQLRVEITDTSGVKGTYYYTLEANASRRISIADFGVAGGTWLADGSFPRNAVIDTDNVKSIRFFVFSPTATPVENAALALDNVVIGSVTDPGTELGNPNGVYLSFEDQEEVVYAHNEQGITASRKEQGATDGRKALNAEFTSFTSYSGDTSGTYSSSIDFTAPEEGWNLGNKPLQMDVTNLLNTGTQLRVEVTDADNHSGIYYFAVGPEQLRTLTISEFDISEASWLTDGYLARATAIDTNRLKTIRLYIYEPKDASTGYAAMAFDRMIIGKIPPIEPSENQLVADAVNALSAASLTFVEGDTAQAVTNHISLPSVGLHGASITWATSHPATVTNDGKVSRPQHGTGNQVVTLTATVTLGAAKATKDIAVTVIQQAATIPAEPEGNSNLIIPAPSTPPSVNIDILVDGKKQNKIARSITTTEGGLMITTITIDREIMDNISDNSIITIPVASNSDVVHGKFNGQMVKDLEQKNAAIELRTSTFSYKLPVQQININELVKPLGSDVKLAEISIDIRISPADADSKKALESTAQKSGFTVVAAPMDFHITYTYKDKTLEINSFNMFVERSIVIPEGVDLTQITTGVVVGSDGSVRQIPTRFVRQDGGYYAVMNSLTNSTYAVIWNPVAFQDVSGHWAESAVNDLGSRLIIYGFEGNLFNPDRYITRAEFTAIMVRALGLRTETGHSAYRDVAHGSWYEAYLNTATTYGLINGYANGQIEPNEFITREQVFHMLERAMKITGLEVAVNMNEVEELLTRFNDASEAATYAKNGIVATIKAGLVKGRNGDLLAPKAAITRAEVAEVVRRLLERSNLI